MVNYANEMGGRVPPQAVDVEESILGSMLLEKEALEIAINLLDSNDFYKPANRHLFESFKVLQKDGGLVDIITTENYLRDKNLLDEVGGSGYVVDLTRSVGSSANIEHYCSIIIEKSLKRQAIIECNEIIKMSYDTGVESYTVLDKLNYSAVNLGQRSSIKHSLTPSEIKDRDKNKPKAEKLFLGYSNLDFGIFGDSMKRGQTILTIADSGHGKTQCALFIAECLLRKNYKIAWFQLEGYDSETADRFDVDNIFICDSLYDIEDIKRESRRLNREHNIDYIVFDYVQNIECNQKISKTEKVEYISKEIQKLGKELNCITNPLSQVTIEESRHGWQQEPRYNDVRWSKQLKQDADLIVSMFRPSRIDSLVINSDSVKDWNDNPVPYNSVFLKQAKVRHGKQEWKRFHMIHTDTGLQPYSNRIDESKAPF